MWELDYKEGCTPKNWCFWTVVLERPLRIPWTARRCNQFILKVSPGCSFEGLMLNLKLQYFGHWMQRTNSFEKALMLEKIEGRRRWDDRGWDGWIASLTQWTWVCIGSGCWCSTGRPGVLQLMGPQTVGHDWATELNWTDMSFHDLIVHFFSKLKVAQFIYPFTYWRTSSKFWQLWIKLL